jgi:lipid-binding SYLF domain-containing protein
VDYRAGGGRLSAKDPCDPNPMKRISFLTILAVLGLLCAPLLRAGESEFEETKRQAEETIALFKKTDSTLKKFFEESAGYVVFPNIGKGGFVFGGAHGKGIVYERTSVVGQASVTQVTFGAQIGGQVLREIVFFETKEAMDRFKQSKLTISAQVSAVAAAEGAGEKARYEESVLVFTRPKEGLMAEASVGGQKFKFTPLQ